MIKFKEVFNISEISASDCKNLLVLACAYDSEDIARFLIDKGFDVNYSDWISRNTPLHFALNNNNFNLANFLLKKGAQETKLNYEDKNPWQLYHSKIENMKKIEELS